MKSDNKLLFFPLISSLLILTTAILALPHPFTPVSNWLENLVRDVDSCACFCPWWLFLTAQILVLLIFSKFYNTRITRTQYLRVLIITTIISNLAHFFGHSYLITRELCSESVFYPYYIWMSLLVFIISWFIKNKENK